MGKRNRSQRRAAKRRRYVNRNERVKPAPMAEAKKMPWPMREMLHAGLITAQQFEAGIEIVAGLDALIAVIKLRGSAVTGRVIAQHVLAEITEAQARAAAIYLGYGQELLKRFQVRPRWVADFVRGEDALKPGGLPLLVAALDLWHDHRDDWDPRLTAKPEQELTSRLPAEPRAVAILAPPAPASAHATASTAAPRAVASYTRRS